MRRGHFFFYFVQIGIYQLASQTPRSLLVSRQCSIAHVFLEVSAICPSHSSKINYQGVTSSSATDSFRAGEAPRFKRHSASARGEARACAARCNNANDRVRFVSYDSFVRRRKETYGTFRFEAHRRPDDNRDRKFMKRRGMT